jgi:anti-sigma B factor antagonist
MGADASSLSDAIRSLVAGGETKVLLNFSEVSYIDSSGIGEMISGLNVVSKNGGTMKLVRLTDRVHNLLRMTKVNTVFEIYEDEAAAAASFGGS